MGKNNVLDLFLKKKWSFFDHFGKMSRVAPGYSQMSCFNIPLESALYKLQNAHKKRISGNHSEYVMK
jgi:hypothetical protein